MTAIKPNALGITEIKTSMQGGELAPFQKDFINKLQKAEVVVMQASTPGKTTVEQIKVLGLRKALAMTRGNYGKHSGNHLEIVSVDGRDVSKQADSIGHAFIMPWQHRSEYINLASMQAGLAPTLFDFNMDKAKQAWFNN